MTSRFGYLLRMIKRLGIFGYVLVFIGVAGVIVSTIPEPLLMIPAYIAFGAFVWFMALKRFVEVERLNDIGLNGEATILSIVENGTSVAINGQIPKPGVTMKAEIHVPGRPAYQAEIKAFISQFELEKFRPGNIVRVKVDPGDQNNIALAEGTPQIGTYAA